MLGDMELELKLDRTPEIRAWYVNKDRNRDEALTNDDGKETIEVIAIAFHAVTDYSVEKLEIIHRI